jgi:inner membrane protein
LNSYGIGWLEPFDHTRFSFGVIFVADPIFSIIPIISLIALIALHAHHKRRSFWWKSGLVAPLFYLLACIHFKFYINRLVESRLKEQKISYTSFYTSPAPLQNALWYMYVKTDSGFYTGYLNLFNNGKDLKPIFFSSNETLISKVSNHESLQHLIRFSQGNYCLEKKKNEIVLNDIRFGQAYGWENNKSPFVFQYSLTHDVNSRLRIQRGRGMIFQQHHFWSLLRRMVRES